VLLVPGRTDRPLAFTYVILKLKIKCIYKYIYIKFVRSYKFKIYMHFEF